MAAKQQYGLGKGLGALLGGEDLSELRKPVGYINKAVVSSADVKPQDTSDVLRIPTELIEPNPYQPRMSFDAQAMQELSDSIRTFGLIQPITVRRKGSKYQIISGERRFRASIMAGMDMVPAYIRDASEQGMLEMAIVENIQRENLDPIEVAMSYQRLMEECRLTQEQMADRVGKKRASVANQLRLLKLPPKVQHDLKVGLVSVGHAKVLLGVEDPSAQEALCDAIVRGGLSVRQLEERVAKLGKEAAPGTAAETEQQELPDLYYRLLERVGRLFGEKISLKRSKEGKGSLTIRFDSDAQMEELLKLLDQR